MDAALGFILFTTLIVVGVMGYFIIMGRINYYKNKWLDEKYWLDTLKEQYRAELDREIKQAVQKSLNAQRAVVKGHVAEAWFPLLISLSGRYTLSDFKYFGGNPFDYILFDGLTEAKDNGGDFKELVIIDIKTGNAPLSAHQKKIRDKINAGYVKCRTFRLLDNGTFIEE